MLDQKIIDDLERFTKEIMVNEEVTEYKLNIEGQTEKGVNYGSEIVFFNVTAKNGKKYHLVMKTTRRAEAVRKQIEDGIADRREMHMYCRVFPALRQMLSESNSQYQLENIPRTFLVNTEYQHETAIMQDLRSVGYKLWDTKNPMNIEHVRTVLENYGKFHAASMALRVKRPQIFKDLTNEMDNIFKNFLHNEGVIQLFRDYVLDAMNILREADLKDTVKQLENYPENIPNILGLEVDEKDRVVVTHGDCWNNNMMFKYQNVGDTKPFGMCFLDFQASFFGSPATDLSYFMYSSLDEEKIEKRMDELLRFYYDSLVSALRNLKVEPEQIFTYQDLEEHWRKYAKFGLVMASTAIKLQLSDRTAAPDFADAEKGIDWSALRVQKVENEDAYRKRIIAVYQHYTKSCLNGENNL